MATPEVENKIEEYKKENPGIFSWEIREKLIQVRNPIQNNPCNSRLLRLKITHGQVLSNEANIIRLFFDMRILRLYASLFMRSSPYCS